MEDNKLIKKCQMGEKEAFQELITKYHPYVYKFLFRLIGDNELAKDMTQETFLKLIKNIEKFNIYGKAKFSTYIIILSRNCYIDYYRKNKNIENIIELNENQKIFYNDVAEEVVDKIYYETITRELKKINSEQQLLIRLKYIEGLTLKEIGESIGIEPKTVKSKIHNGMVKFRNLLKGADEIG